MVGRVDQHCSHCRRLRRQPVPALQPSALAVAVTRCGPGMTMGEIARAIGVTKSTLLRKMDAVGKLLYSKTEVEFTADDEVSRDSLIGSSKGMTWSLLTWRILLSLTSPWCWR
jgi:hypothetical protein